jgi:hypothetical protein
VEPVDINGDRADQDCQAMFTWSNLHCEYVVLLHNLRYIIFWKNKCTLYYI